MNDKPWIDEKLTRMRPLLITLWIAAAIAVIVRVT